MAIKSCDNCWHDDPDDEQGDEYPCNQCTRNLAKCFQDNWSAKTPEDDKGICIDGNDPIEVEEEKL